MNTATAGYLDRYAGLAAQLPGDAALRAAAAAAFRASGLPGARQRRRMEAWKYTSLRSVDEADLHRGMARSPNSAEAVVEGLRLLDAPRIVFVDGAFRDNLTNRPETGFSRFAERPDFGTLADPDREPLVALNTMLAADGAVVEVPPDHDGGVLQLVSVCLGGVDSHPRHSVHLGNGSKLTLVEISSGRDAYVLNSVAEIHLGAGSHFTHIRLQDEAVGAFHMSTTYACIEAGGTYDSFTLNVGARLSRTEVHTRLAGAGATAHLNAAQVLAGSQHGDFTSVVSHDAPGCTSRQTVKNVLADRSHGVFQGKIEVARHAVKTDGYQMNQTLLLSPDAEIDAKPELEIFADDVKCSHGATVGELDTEQLFYLRSRGLPEPEARSILVRAFLANAMALVSNDTIRGLLEAAVGRWWERQEP